MIACLRKNTKYGRRIRSSVLVAVVAMLGGCASLADPPAKCDGYSRRPLNRSMWTWEDDRELPRAQSHARSPMSATPYVEEDRTPAAFAQFDIDGSRRHCTG